MKNKHLHLARRKMSHVIDEIYTALLRTGGGEVQLRIIREEGGLRLLAAGDFTLENQHHIQRMAELLQPAVRPPPQVQAEADPVRDAVGGAAQGAEPRRLDGAA